MSGYILCQGIKAVKPYYIESISTNIYTIEELCYYLYHNLELIDESLINEALCQWIQEELERKELAVKLRGQLEKPHTLQDIIYPVFKEINYVSYEELKILNSKLAKLSREKAIVRSKMKADCLMENRIYGEAMKVYHQILEKLETEEEPRAGFLKSIWHNLGCAYSYLFQKEQALECFEKAWKRGEEEEALKTYLYAWHQKNPQKNLEISALQKNASPQLIEEVLKNIQMESDQESPLENQQVDELLEKLTKEYHRSTGS